MSTPRRSDSLERPKKYSKNMDVRPTASLPRPMLSTVPFSLTPTLRVGEYRRSVTRTLLKRAIDEALYQPVRDE